MVAQKVVEEAQGRLGQSSHLFLRHVECHVEGHTLYLDGKVPSFYLKQTAQSLLKSLDGVKQVDNRLQVVSASGISSVPAKTY
ncbi:MAG: BON domain-containing protein [Planctomycetota bacterium]